MKSIDPRNNRTIREHSVMSTSEWQSAIEKSHQAWEEWKNTPYPERSALFVALGNELRNYKAHYAEVITQEMGKVISESLSEVEKCASLCEYYADNGEEFLKDQPIKTEAAESFVTYRPLGLVLGIMPWNFPFWQVMRFAVPAMYAGNGAVLKHAPNVMQCAKEIEAAFVKAGFPEGIFTNLVIPVEEVSAVMEHKHIAAVTITASTQAGKAVAEKAGSLLKKSVMELGGSDPYIVLEDANLELAVDTCVKSRLINSGQSCIAAKRFIIVEKVYDSFLKRFVEAMNEKTFGDPTTNVDLGPLARPDLRDNVHKQVTESIKGGAELVTGGEIPKMDGNYYPATVLANVKPGIAAFEEEIFGPVAAVIKAKDENDAINLANQTSYGLGACVFTQDMERGRKLAKEQLDAGCCFVNELVHSDPRLPFGGIKESGYGRELGPLGIHEFTNAKTVYIK